MEIFKENQLAEFIFKNKMLDTELNDRFSKDERFDQANSVEKKSKFNYFNLKTLKQNSRYTRYNDNLRLGDIMQHMDNDPKKPTKKPKPFNNVNNYKLPDRSHTMRYTNNEKPFYNYNTNQFNYPNYTPASQQSDRTSEKDKLMNKKQFGLEINSIMISLTPRYAQNDVQESCDQVSIKQKIINSIDFYNNFVSNPLTTNTNLVNPNFHQDLLGIKRSSSYSYKRNSPNSEVKPNLSYRLHANMIKQQGFIKSDTIKRDKYTTAPVIDSSGMQINSLNSKSNESNTINTISQRIDPLLLSSPTVDLDNKRVSMDKSGNDDSMRIELQISPDPSLPPQQQQPISPIGLNNKNIFLNYRLNNFARNHIIAPPTTPNYTEIANAAKNSTDLGIHLSVEKHSTEKLASGNDKLSNEKASNEKLEKITTFKDQAAKYRKVLTAKQPLDPLDEYDTFEGVQISVSNHEAEKYLDRSTIMRIEKWISQVNAAKTSRN